MAFLAAPLGLFAKSSQATGHLQPTRRRNLGLEARARLPATCGETPRAPGRHHAALPWLAHCFSVHVPRILGMQEPIGAMRRAERTERLWAAIRLPGGMGLTWFSWRAAEVSLTPEN